MIVTQRWQGPANARIGSEESSRFAAAIQRKYVHESANYLGHQGLIFREPQGEVAVQQTFVQQVYNTYRIIRPVQTPPLPDVMIRSLYNWLHTLRLSRHDTILRETSLRPGSVRIETTRNGNASSGMNAAAHTNDGNGTQQRKAAEVVPGLNSGMAERLQVVVRQLFQGRSPDWPDIVNSSSPNRLMQRVAQLANAAQSASASRSLVEHVNNRATGVSRISDLFYDIPSRHVQFLQSGAAGPLVVSLSPMRSVLAPNLPQRDDAGDRWTAKDSLLPSKLYQAMRVQLIQGTVPLSTLHRNWLEPAREIAGNSGLPKTADGVAPFLLNRFGLEKVRFGLIGTSSLSDARPTPLINRSTGQTGRIERLAEGYIERFARMERIWSDYRSTAGKPDEQRERQPLQQSLWSRLVGAAQLQQPRQPRTDRSYSERVQPVVPERRAFQPTLTMGDMNDQPGVSLRQAFRRDERVYLQPDAWQGGRLERDYWAQMLPASPLITTSRSDAYMAGSNLGIGESNRSTGAGNARLTELVSSLRLSPELQPSLSRDRIAAMNRVPWNSRWVEFSNRSAASHKADGRLGIPISIVDFPYAMSVPASRDGLLRAYGGMSPVMPDLIMPVSDLAATALDRLRLLSSVPVEPASLTGMSELVRRAAGINGFPGARLESFVHFGLNPLVMQFRNGRTEQSSIQQMSEHIQSMRQELRAELFRRNPLLPGGENRSGRDEVIDQARFPWARLSSYPVGQFAGEGNRSEDTSRINASAERLAPTDNVVSQLYIPQLARLNGSFHGWNETAGQGSIQARRQLGQSAILRNIAALDTIRQRAADNAVANFWNELNTFHANRLIGILEQPDFSMTNNWLMPVMSRIGVNGFGMPLRLTELDQITGSMSLLHRRSLQHIVEAMVVQSAAGRGAQQSERKAFVEPEVNRSRIPALAGIVQRFAGSLLNRARTEGVNLAPRRFSRDSSPELHGIGRRLQSGTADGPQQIRPSSLLQLANVVQPHSRISSNLALHRLADMVYVQRVALHGSRNAASDRSPLSGNKEAGNIPSPASAQQIAANVRQVMQRKQLGDDYRGMVLQSGTAQRMAPGQLLQRMPDGSSGQHRLTLSRALQREVHAIERRLLLRAGTSLSSSGPLHSVSGVGNESGLTSGGAGRPIAGLPLHRVTDAGIGMMRLSPESAPIWNIYQALEPNVEPSRVLQSFASRSSGGQARQFRNGILERTAAIHSPTSGLLVSASPSIQLSDGNMEELWRGVRPSSAYTFSRLSSAEAVHGDVMPQLDWLPLSLTIAAARANRLQANEPADIRLQNRWPANHIQNLTERRRSEQRMFQPNSFNRLEAMARLLPVLLPGLKQLHADTNRFQAGRGQQRLPVQQEGAPVAIARRMVGQTAIAQRMVAQSAANAPSRSVEPTSTGRRGTRLTVIHSFLQRLNPAAKLVTGKPANEMSGMLLGLTDYRAAQRLPLNGSIFPMPTAPALLLPPTFLTGTGQIPERLIAWLETTNLPFKRHDWPNLDLPVMEHRRQAEATESLREQLEAFRQQLNVQSSLASAGRRGSIFERKRTPMNSDGSIKRLAAQLQVFARQKQGRTEKLRTAAGIPGVVQLFQMLAQTAQTARGPIPDSSPMESRTQHTAIRLFTQWNGPPSMVRTNNRNSSDNRGRLIGQPVGQNLFPMITINPATAAGRYGTTAPVSTWLRRSGMNAESIVRFAQRIAAGLNRSEPMLDANKASIAAAHRRLPESIHQAIPPIVSSESTPVFADALTRFVTPVTPVVQLQLRRNDRVLYGLIERMGLRNGRTEPAERPAGGAGRAEQTMRVQMSNRTVGQLAEGDIARAARRRLDDSIAQSRRYEGMSRIAQAAMVITAAVNGATRSSLAQGRTASMVIHFGGRRWLTGFPDGQRIQLVSQAGQVQRVPTAEAPRLSAGQRKQGDQAAPSMTRGSYMLPYMDNSRFMTHRQQSEQRITAEQRNVIPLYERVLERVQAQLTTAASEQDQTANGLRLRASGQAGVIGYDDTSMHYLKPAARSAQTAPDNKAESASTQKVVHTQTVMEAAAAKPVTWNKTDIDKLADKVFKEIERKLLFERQRRGL